MEAEKSILKRPNHEREQSIAGKMVIFKSPEKIQKSFAEQGFPQSQKIPLDVYGKPEIYRWRTAYDEAYNVDKQVS